MVSDIRKGPASMLVSLKRRLLCHLSSSSDFIFKSSQMLSLRYSISYPSSTFVMKRTVVGLVEVKHEVGFCCAFCFYQVCAFSFTKRSRARKREPCGLRKVLYAWVQIRCPSLVFKLTFYFLSQRKMTELEIITSVTCYTLTAGIGPVTGTRFDSVFLRALQKRCLKRLVHLLARSTTDANVVSGVAHQAETARTPTATSLVERQALGCSGGCCCWSRCCGRSGRRSCFLTQKNSKWFKLISI